MRNTNTFHPGDNLIVHLMDAEVGLPERALLVPTRLYGFDEIDEDSVVIHGQQDLLRTVPYTRNRWYLSTYLQGVLSMGALAQLPNLIKQQPDTMRSGLPSFNTFTSNSTTSRLQQSTRERHGQGHYRAVAQNSSISPPNVKAINRRRQKAELPNLPFRARC